MKKVDNEIFFARAEELLAEGLEVEMLHAGQSMRPLLRHGRDRLVLAPCNGREALPGDVILFRYRGRHVLHRVLRHDNGMLELAGDGNYRMTERCTEEDVAARLVRVIRPSGRIVACSSARWSVQSRCWLLLPAPMRRLLLRIGWHLGWR